VADRAREDRAHGQDRARRGGAVERRRGGGALTGRRLAALLLALPLAAGCPKAPPAPKTPEPAEPTIAETALPPSGEPRFEIGPINERRSDDGAELYVESSVLNTGTRESRDVKVSVEALDDHGIRLAETEVYPTPQEIPPGGAARFVARLRNDPAIRTFHVEAIGR